MKDGDDIDVKQTINNNMQMIHYSFIAEIHTEWSSPYSYLILNSSVVCKQPQQFHRTEHCTLIPIQ